MEVKNVNEVSEKLLLAVKMQKSTEQFIELLEGYSREEFHLALNNDENKKAFWINIYNAFFQILRLAKNLKKPEIYKEKHIVIAGRYLSLDDIEHGILRRFQYKYALGYLPDIFAPDFIKKMAVEIVDYRIHFALNCGAKSCPPIAFYSSAKVNEQLDLATISFLELETELDKENKKVFVTSLFKWYLKDFGGMEGVKEIVEEKLNAKIEGFEILFKEYSWEEELQNFDKEAFG